MVESLKNVDDWNFYDCAVKLKYDEIWWFEVYHLLIDEVGILRGRFTDFIQKLVAIVALNFIQIFI